MQPEVLLADEIGAGRLARLLPACALPSQAMHLAYPCNRHMSARLKSFVEFVLQRFRQE